MQGVWADSEVSTAIPSICFGIDPGVATGLAMTNCGKLVSIQTVDFVRAYHHICEYSPDRVLKIVIEISRETHVWHPDAKKLSRQRAMAMAQDVGGVRREGQLLMAMLQYRGYNVKAVPPRGKLKDPQFKKITGYEGRTSQHGRDAGMLIYGL